MVWIGYSDFIELLTFAMKHRTLETGGVFIGYRAINSDYVITKVIGPGPKAIHKRFTFEPDQDYHERMIAKDYELSQGQNIYLGDWHTHPDSNAYLSDKDKKTLTLISTYDLAQIAEPIMLVLGTNPLSLKVWSTSSSSRFLRGAYRKQDLKLF